MNQVEVLDEIRRVCTESENVEGAVRQCMRVLADRFPTYKWVGVYWLVGGELVLGPYVGAATNHARIPIGRGVCGAAVAAGRNQVVRDVRELDNYLACSTETRSEIVVLIRDSQGTILGQIDIDGHEVGAFTESDERLLEAVATVIVERVEQEGNHEQEG